MEASPDNRELRTLKLTVLLYTAIFAMKMVAFYFTGVIAVLAEAMHTLSDVFISAFLLLASVWSRKEADEEHMYGHGRAQNVAALVAATLFISFTSFRLYEEAIPRLFQPQEASHENLPLALAVLIFSMVLAAIPLVRLIVHRSKGAAAKAQLMELVNDELGLLAALAGTAFLMAGHPIADPIAAIAVATIIVLNAVGLFRENVSYLLGRSPSPEYMKRIAGTARAVPGVVGIRDLRAEYIGPDTVFSTMHIEVPRGLPIEEADRIAEEVRERVHDTVGCQFCMVHVDPAGGYEPRTPDG